VVEQSCQHADNHQPLKAAIDRQDRSDNGKKDDRNNRRSKLRMKSAEEGRKIATLGKCEGEPGRNQNQRAEVSQYRYAGQARDDSAGKGPEKVASRVSQRPRRSRENIQWQGAESNKLYRKVESRAQTQRDNQRPTEIPTRILGLGGRNHRVLK